MKQEKPSPDKTYAFPSEKMKKDEAKRTAAGVKKAAGPKMDDAQKTEKGKKPGAKKQ